MTRDEIYAFGEFELDVGNRRLSRGKCAVPLAPKALDLLATLVRNGGRLVVKRDLLEAVWPDAFVEEGILSVHISSLRKALDDRNGGRPYIETVARSGYRFAAPVTHRHRAAALRLRRSQRSARRSSGPRSQRSSIFRSHTRTGINAATTT